MAQVEITIGGASVYSGIGSDFYVGQKYEEMSFVKSTVMDIDTQREFYTLDQVVGGELSTMQCL